MIPLRDDIKSSKRPVFVYVIIMANVLVFLYEMSLGQGLGRFIGSYGFVPHRIVFNLLDSRTIVTLFSSMFIHAGIIHILGNMLFLWIFGDNVEDFYGHGLFVLFYLLCGLAGSLLHTLVSPNSMVPSVGASGAISGVMGSYVLLYPRARILALIPFGFFMRVSYIPALFFVGFWFLLQVLYGFALGGANAGIAYFAHIGGFVAGVLFTLLLRLNRRPCYQIK